MRSRFSLLAVDDVDALSKKDASKNDAQLLTFGNVLASCMLTVALVLVCLLLVRAPPTPLPVPCPENASTAALVADNSTCGMTNACQQGFVSADNASCLVRPRGANTTCQSACTPVSEEPSGMCDGHGVCVPTTCPDVCEDSEDCGAIPVLKEVLPEFAVREPGAECLHHVCVYGVIDVYAISNAEENDGWAPVGARMLCSDYIKPEILAERPGCFVSERFLLSSVYFGHHDWGNASFPMQLSYCLIRWSCSHFVAFDLESTAAAPLKTLGERGLTPVETSRAPDEPYFGITDARQRNAVFAWIEESLDEAVPQFLEQIASMSQAR